MKETVSPAKSISGIITVPGDKSVSHRYGMLTAIAEGESKIANYSTGADCQSTLGCMAALGAKIERKDGLVIVEGGALSEPKGELDAGNSGSTIRMLSGILAAQKFTSRIGGDESLSKRPMKRIIAPLTEMGAKIDADGGFPPLTIHGRPLKGSITRCRWRAPR
jgi:3-phosphoshikimate 1-carboxyvinyltransferase